MRLSRLAAIVSIPVWLAVLSLPAGAATCLISIFCLPPVVAPPAPALPPAPDVQVPPPSTVTAPVTNAVNNLTTPHASVDSMESQMLSLINAERSSAGEPPLQNAGWAHSVARAFSEKMAAAGLSIWHNTDYIAQGRSAMGATALGENVGLDSSVQANHTGFMASPHHRDNILNSGYTNVGIGVAVNASGGVFVTEDFARIPGGASASTGTASPVASRAHSTGAFSVAAAQVNPVKVKADAPTIVLPAALGGQDNADKTDAGHLTLAKAASALQTGSGGPSSPMVPAITTTALLALAAPAIWGLKRLLVTLAV